MWPFSKKEKEKVDKSSWSMFMRVEICEQCGNHPSLHMRNEGDVRFRYGICGKCGSDKIRKSVGQFKVHRDWMLGTCYMYETDFNERSK